MNNACAAVEGEYDSSIMTQCNSNNDNDYNYDHSPDTSKYGISQALEGDSDSQRKTYAAIAGVCMNMCMCELMCVEKV